MVLAPKCFENAYDNRKMGTAHVATLQLMICQGHSDHTYLLQGGETWIDSGGRSSRSPHGDIWFFPVGNFAVLNLGIFSHFRRQCRCVRVIPISSWTTLCISERVKAISPGWCEAAKQLTWKWNQNCTHAVLTRFSIPLAENSQQHARLPSSRSMR